MKRKSTKVAVATILVSAIAGGLVGASSASAAPATVTQANADYVSSIAAAKASFLAAVKPSRATMIDEGKRAEVARRLSVKAGLAAFNAVVTAEKAPSLVAEKTYKNAVTISLGSPTNLAFKTAVTTDLAALSKATTALSTDAKIAAARTTFAKIRTSAMAKFKAALVISATERARTLERASLRYKADKARAYAALQVALKKTSK